MIALEKAKKILDDYLLEVLPIFRRVETVPLWEAGGRVLAEDVVAGEDAPAFNRSHVDGYAFLAADSYGAAPNSPVTLTIIDTIAAGSYSLKEITPGTAMKIFTGAPLPPAADCIIKKEEIEETFTASGAAIIIKRAVGAGENISNKGEDLTSGDFLLSRGTIISSAQVEILATLGIDPVTVYARPQIGIFSTGNELVTLQNKLQHGQLRASNIYTLAEIIRRAGGSPVNLGIVRDRADDVLQAYAKADQLQLPMVISTGGTASGDFDVTKAAMEQAGSSRLFNKVAMRPGAPFVVSKKENRLLIGLSGNPGGAIVTMFIFLFPMISKLAGDNKYLSPSRGRLTGPIVRQGGLRGFFWGCCDKRGGRLYVTPFRNQFCGAIKVHLHSNCLIEVPAGKVNLLPGDDVNIWHLPCL
ncbi:MAG TPA: molybdopterin molybdotransferase MoeA [Firmicutes bacterium]|jgi:molybdopterin molybdotransferase|nr:molybdopterin molybdotransferase MoeA [Bacillota bacterium]